MLVIDTLLSALLVLDAIPQQTIVPRVMGPQAIESGTKSMDRSGGGVKAPNVTLPIGLKSLGVASVTSYLPLTRLITPLIYASPKVSLLILLSEATIAFVIKP